MTNKKTTINAGFTLIETLVAILILTTAIVGPLTIVEKGLNASLIAKDQVLAFNLAQDAVEYARFRRDTNRLSGNADWLAGLDGAGGCTSTDRSASCIVDSIQNTVVPCVNGTCPALNFNSTTHQYTYSGVGGSVASTIFTRAISIKTPISGNANEAELTVSVSWQDQGTLTRTVVVRENIFNWQ